MSTFGAAILTLTVYSTLPIKLVHKCLSCLTCLQTSWILDLRLLWWECRLVNLLTEFLVIPQYFLPIFLWWRTYQLLHVLFGHVEPGYGQYRVQLYCHNIVELDVEVDSPNLARGVTTIMLHKVQELCLCIQLLHLNEKQHSVSCFSMWRDYLLQR